VFKVCLHKADYIRVVHLLMQDFRLSIKSANVIDGGQMKDLHRDQHLIGTPTCQVHRTEAPGIEGFQEL